MTIAGGGDLCASIGLEGTPITTIACPSGCDQDQWTLTMGGTGQQTAHSILAHSSGDLVIAGWTSVGQNVLLTRVTMDGGIVWSRTYDLGSNDTGSSVNVEEAPDGGLLLTGSRGTTGGFVLRTTADGAVLWTRILFPQWTAQTRVVRPAADGSVLVAGTVNAGVFGSSEAFISRVDGTTGALLWSRLYGGSANDHFTDLTEMPGGDLVLSGEVQSFGGVRKGWHVRCSAGGAVLSSRQYGGSGSSAFIRHIPHGDGSFTRVGLTNGVGQGGYDIWVARTAASGELLWSYVYGTASDERAVSALDMPDGGLVLAAADLDAPAITWARLDAAGNVQWAYSSADLGTAYPALYAPMIAQAHDGSFVVIGSSASPGGDLRVIKGSGCGSSACAGVESAVLVREPYQATNAAITTVQSQASTSSASAAPSVQDGTAALVASALLEECAGNGPCTALGSNVTVESDTVCLVRGQATITAAPGDNTVPEGYAVAYLITQGDDRTVVGLDAAPSFIINVAGTWYIHTLVYDPATLDPAVALDMTIADLRAQFLEGGGTLCASVDPAGTMVTTLICSTGCTAYAAGMATDIGPVCLVDGQAVLTATPVGASVVPPGYQVAYLLSRTNALILDQVATVPAFTVHSVDVWRIHALVYDPATLDLSAWPAGTYLYDLQDLLVQGGGTLCASLDISGAPVKTAECEVPCTAQASGMTADIGPVCLVDGTATLTATPVGSAVVPTGYAVAYVLTRTNGLIIEQVGAEPTFTVTSEDIWRIHALVYDPATLDLATLTPGTYAYDVQDLLVQGGGTLCASLDISGAPIKTGLCEGPSCTGGEDVSITVCYTAAPFFLFDSIPGDPCPQGTWSSSSDTPIPTNGWFDPLVQTSQAYLYTAPLPDGTSVGVVVNVTLVECPGGVEEDQPGKVPAGIATGVVDVAAPDGMALWPNPASGTVQVRLPYALTTGARLELIDAAGRTVALPFVRHAQGLVFDARPLAAGAWTLRVVDKDHVSSARFVRVGE